MNFAAACPFGGRFFIIKSLTGMYYPK